MSKSRAFFAIGTIKFAFAAALLAVVGWAAAPFANANPISFYSNNSQGNPPPLLRFTLGCGSATGDCTGKLEALTGTATTPGTWSSTTGGLYNFADYGLGNGTSTATETSFVNLVVSPDVTFLTKTDGSSSFPGSGGEFDVSADYFLIKIGFEPSHALFHNIGGGTLDLFFTGGQGGGLSHLTAFGKGTPGGGGGGGGGEVPEPSSLGMLGLGLLVIAGLAIRTRRQRDRKAE